MYSELLKEYEIGEKIGSRTVGTSYYEWRETALARDIQAEYVVGLDDPVSLQVVGETTVYIPD